MRTVFAAPTLDQARAAARVLAASWQPSHPAVATTIDEEIEDGLACFRFPRAHGLRIRTTNGLERLNQELKRRTRVVRIFPKRAALLRLVTALAMEQREEWLSLAQPFWTIIQPVWTMTHQASTSIVGVTRYAKPYLE